MNFAWIDIETTGFDPDEDVVLEIGVIVTTPSLQEVARYHHVIPYKCRYPMSAHPEAAEIHEKSGLWKECLCAYENGMVESAWIDRLDSFFERNGGAKGLTLAGSSVHFDRSFLVAAGITNSYHYRNLDVSSTRIQMEMLGRLPPGEPVKKKVHRAMPDIEETLAEFRWLWETE